MHIMWCGACTAPEEKKRGMITSTRPLCQKRQQDIRNQYQYWFSKKTGCQQDQWRFAWGDGTDASNVLRSDVSVVAWCVVSGGVVRDVWPSVPSPPNSCDQQSGSVAGYRLSTGKTGFILLYAIPHTTFPRCANEVTARVAAGCRWVGLRDILIGNMQIEYGRVASYDVLYRVNIMSARRNMTNWNSRMIWARLNWSEWRLIHVFHVLAVTHSCAYPTCNYCWHAASEAAIAASGACQRIQRGADIPILVNWVECQLLICFPGTILYFSSHPCLLPAPDLRPIPCHASSQVTPVFRVFDLLHIYVLIRRMSLVYTTITPRLSKSECCLNILTK